MSEQGPRRYQCRRVNSPIDIDGSLRDPAWADLPWTENFLDITGDESWSPQGAVNMHLPRRWGEVVFE